ncbi:cysteine--tRNA ligase [Gorillibacterium massiliense]|uniref:cysteine--tRNA ligase n=1 Tax=Gorillibacterium massiliense TaxID=1280390 RepID=UPI0004B1915E|nr:cysteine--tRNA ligase [Gorillibacterium massiliense]
MTLKIFNSLSRSKEEFKSIEPGKVTMYVCGPTVYDYIHIGNARPVIVFDTVRRYLQTIGYEVRYVTNLTDVDDKLIRKSENTGEPVPVIADKYVAAFLEDSAGLGVKDTIHPRVTENMDEIIAFIAGLVEKGIAYEKGGDVFFRTRQFPKYGQISHKNFDELQYGIRIEVDERKESPQDFVLWKAAKPGEIKWSSPWGEGRPGWHIECSAMAEKYLGITIDIHGGGQDLEFPHHECEAAQSEALHGHPLANYWMHNGYLNINNEKMSKSLGNGLRVKDILTRTSGAAVRFAILSAHYRNPLNYSDEVLHQAEAGVERLGNSVANVRHRLSAAIPGEKNEDLATAVEAALALFSERMNDDFNTADAITAMFELAAAANRYLQEERTSKGMLELILDAFEQMDGVLGILPAAEEELGDAEIDKLIEERTAARKAKEWARADEIRDILTEKGIILEDTPQGLRWRRK